MAIQANKSQQPGEHDIAMEMLEAINQELWKAMGNTSQQPSDYDFDTKNLAN